MFIIFIMFIAYVHNLYAYEYTPTNTPLIAQYLVAACSSLHSPSLHKKNMKIFSQQDALQLLQRKNSSSEPELHIHYNSLLNPSPLTNAKNQTRWLLKFATEGQCCFYMPAILEILDLIKLEAFTDENTQPRSPICKLSILYTTCQIAQHIMLLKEQCVPYQQCMDHITHGTQPLLERMAQCKNALPPLSHTTPHTAQPSTAPHLNRNPILLFIQNLGPNIYCAPHNLRCFLEEDEVSSGVLMFTKDLLQEILPITLQKIMANPIDCYNIVSQFSISFTLHQGNSCPIECLNALYYKLPYDAEIIRHLLLIGKCIALIQSKKSTFINQTFLWALGAFQHASTTTPSSYFFIKCLIASHIFASPEDSHRLKSLLAKSLPDQRHTAQSKETAIAEHLTQTTSLDTIMQHAEQLYSPAILELYKLTNPDAQNWPELFSYIRTHSILAPIGKTQTLQSTICNSSKTAPTVTVFNFLLSILSNTKNSCNEMRRLLFFLNITHSPDAALTTQSLQTFMSTCGSYHSPTLITSAHAILTLLLATHNKETPLNLPIFEAFLSSNLEGISPYKSNIIAVIHPSAILSALHSTILIQNSMYLKQRKGASTLPAVSATCDLEYPLFLSEEECSKLVNPHRCCHESYSLISVTPLTLPPSTSPHIISHISKRFADCIANGHDFADPHLHTFPGKQNLSLPYVLSKILTSHLHPSTDYFSLYHLIPFFPNACLHDLSDPQKILPFLLNNLHAQKKDTSAIIQFTYALYQLRTKKFPLEAQDFPGSILPKPTPSSLFLHYINIFQIMDIARIVQGA